MNDENPQLMEEDYLKVIEIIHSLKLCETKKDLGILVSEVISRVFDVQHVGFVWSDMDLVDKAYKLPKIFYHFGCSDREMEIAAKTLPYLKGFTQKSVSSLRPVLAHDVDLPREVLEQELDAFFADHPQHTREELGNAAISRRFLVINNPLVGGSIGHCEYTDCHGQSSRLGGLRQSNFPESLGFAKGRVFTERFS
jgi:hypothetical protein